MDKAQAIIHHYGSGNADFVIRANGKLEWEGPGECPTDEQIEQWESERIKYVAINKQKTECIDNLQATDYALLEDFEYQSDKPGILALRAEWKRILKSDKIETVPKNTYRT